MWLADNDPVKEEAVNRKPLLEYWFILNERIIDYKKELAKAKAREMQNRHRKRK